MLRKKKNCNYCLGSWQLIFITAFLLGGCTQFPDRPRALAQKAGAFYTRAVEGYEKLLVKRPGDIEIRLALARLYASHGAYQNAAAVLKNREEHNARQLLAICLYKAGEYTEALSIFERLGKIQDGEYLYYYGLTCQKHNLYEQAIEIFNQIKDKEYLPKAKERLAAIQ